MTENDIPLVSFFKRLLDPAIILGLLYAIIVSQHEVFTGDYLVLMIIAFFVSSFVYEQIDLYRTLHVGKHLAYAVDILQAGLQFRQGASSALGRHRRLQLFRQGHLAARCGPR